ncbi:MAG: hypothetical protein ACTS5Y_10290, partial [Pollutimonas bauzanensis]
MMPKALYCLLALALLLAPASSSGRQDSLLSMQAGEVKVLAIPGVARVAHLHRNTPGVLAAVNKTLAEHGT